MDYTRLGHSGLQVSRLCLGCMSFGGGQSGAYGWTLEEGDSRPIIRRALEAGINFFDTANGYSKGRSEEIIGRALRDFARRDEVVLATKAYAPWRGAPNTGGLSRKALFQAIDDSLVRLGMDYIDLYQIHRWDYDTPIEETMEALHDLVKAGKVRYIGASSMYAWQFQKANYIAERHGWSRFISMQNHLNLLNREEEREMLPLCADMGVGVIPWSPLARGRLARAPGTDSKRAGSDVFADSLYAATGAQDQMVINAVGAIAAERAVPRAHVALAWLLAKSEVTAPIVGTTRVDQLDEAIAALPLRLAAKEIARLEEHYVPHAVVGLYPPKPTITAAVTLRS